MYCYNCMNEKGSADICPYCHLDHSMEPAAHHLRPGTVLCGKYVVGYVIGEGGFGITYIGRDTTLDMRVAIKEFYPAGCTNRNSFAGSGVEVAGGRQRDFFQKGKARFLYEARNVAKFSAEPGIVDVRDYFEENGTAYIIMEYLDGIDLNRYLNHYGPLPARQAFELMLPVMHSLEKIHAAGIIHRDISPDNIMYLKNGTLKLMDFGSARYFTHTETEMSVMLKPGYSPEEQYRKNGQQGPWTDVYGMCATLYRVITGEVPVNGLDRMHRDTLRRPSEMGIEISPAFEAVLMYGLAVFSGNRCQSMAELISLTHRALKNAPLQMPAASQGGFAPRRAADAGARVSPDRRSYGDSYTALDERQKEKKFPVAAIIIIVTAALLLIGGAVALFLLRDSGNAGDADSTAAFTEAATEPTQPPTEAPIMVIDVTGQKVDKAVTALQEKGFEVSIDYVDSDRPENIVVSQSPDPGTWIAPGSKVVIYLPQEKPTEPPTEPPTQEPTEDRATYVNLCIGGAWFHETDSRVSLCYSEGIAYGDEVQFLNLISGEFMKVRYHGVDGWVLSKYLVLKSLSDDADTVYDREYNEPVICVKSAFLYTDTGFRNGIRIPAGEEAVQVGYCPAEHTTRTLDYYEIYYKGNVYYLPYTTLHNYFEYVNS